MLAEQGMSENKFVVSFLSIVLITITGIILLQPGGQYSRYLTNHAVYVMFGMLAFGLVFLLLKHHKIMLVSFACAGALAYFLKGSSNQALSYPERNVEVSLDVVHVNISNHDGDYESLCSMLENSEADLISIQEVTPDWNIFLRQTLEPLYPFNKSVVSIGFNGMAIYSKYPILEIDTFYHEDIPNITGIIEVGDEAKKPLRFLSTYTNPTFETQSLYPQLLAHFKTIIRRMEDKAAPELALGTFNAVAWSTEMKYLTNHLNLVNSRRPVDFFEQNSYEHIFHSNRMECTALSPFIGEENNAIGVKGSFQFKPYLAEN